METRLQHLRSVFTVEPIIFLYMTATFLVTPCYQQLIITKECSRLYGGPHSEVCSDLLRHPEEQEEVQAASSMVLLLYTAVLSLVSVPPALLLGSWSDRRGGEPHAAASGVKPGRRRVVLLLPAVLSLASGGLMIAMSLVQQMGALWTLMSAALVGLSGGTTCLFLSSFSYIADLTASKGGVSRTLRMAIAEAMVYVGGTVGYLLGGYLEQHTGLLSAFVCYCCCHFLSIVYNLVWLRDPAPPPLTTPTTDEGGNLGDGAGGEGEASDAGGGGALSHARRSFAVVFQRRAGRDRLKLLLLIACSFINHLVIVGETTVSFLFLTYPPRDFSTELYGIFNSVRMVALGVVLLFVFPVLMKCVAEQTLAKVSALCRAASLFTMAFSTNTWMVFLVCVIQAPSGILQAVIRSLCSAIVEPHEQGAMFSMLASVEALCILIAGLCFNGLYPLTLTSVAGMPFVVMGTFMLVLFILMQWVSELPATQPRLNVETEGPDSDLPKPT